MFAKRRAANARKQQVLGQKAKRLKSNLANASRNGVHAPTTHAHHINRQFHFGEPLSATAPRVIEQTLQGDNS